MTRILLIGKASTLSAQLAALQDETKGLVLSGKPIRWDSRVDTHPDYLAVEGK